MPLLLPWLNQWWWHRPTLRLESPLVYIRPMAWSDWPDWVEERHASRPFLTPWEPSWPVDVLTRPAFYRRLRRQTLEWLHDEAYSFLVFTRQDDRLVGGLGLTHVRRSAAQTATLGYWVSARHARRGYISAAARLALHFAFNTLDLHRVEASCLPHNVPSRGLLEKLGFRHEGYARGYLRIDGQWRDHVLYGILRDDRVYPAPLA